MGFLYEGDVLRHMKFRQYYFRRNPTKAGSRGPQVFAHGRFLYVLPGTSHDASGKRCAQSIMRDFLNNPREEAVNDCLLVEELSVFKDPGFHPTSEPETFRDAAPEERGQY